GGLGPISIWIRSGAVAMGRDYCARTGAALRSSQRMQVGRQIIQLLLGQLLLEGRHLGAAQEDDVGDPVVIGGNAVLHEWLFEQPVQAGCAQVMCTVGVMAFGATRVVNAPALRLLRSQP